MTKKAFVVAGVLILVAPLIWAGTTGQLTGFVFDENGAPLVGVTVSASSPSQIGSVHTTITGADGSFRFPRLAPGYYEALFELVGYGPQQLEQVQVRLDRTTGLQVTLRRTDFAAEIEVIETTPIVDPVQTSTGQVFSSKYITTTSSSNYSLVTQTAGASSQDAGRVLGSTPQDGAFLLDGMDSTNWYQRFANPAGVNFIFDVAHEVAIHTSGYEAEYGQATGAIFNLTTKSGGNSFSGTLDARYTGSSFEAGGDHYDPDERESGLSRNDCGDIGADLILKDRLWFFGSIARLKTEDTGYNAPVTADYLVNSFLGKITWQANSSWSVFGMYNEHARCVNDNFPSSQFRALGATVVEKGKSRRSPASPQPGCCHPQRCCGSSESDARPRTSQQTPSDGDLPDRWPLQYRPKARGSEITMARTTWRTLLEPGVDRDLVVRECRRGARLQGRREPGPTPDFRQQLFEWERCRTVFARGIEELFLSAISAWSGEDTPIPYQMDVSRADGPLDYGADALATFVQDNWRIRPNLNLNLGMRWDRVTWNNETGQIANLTQLQPRIGVAWDLLNNGKNLFRASWGGSCSPEPLCWQEWK